VSVTVAVVFVYMWLLMTIGGCCNCQFTSTLTITCLQVIHSFTVNCKPKFTLPGAAFSTVPRKILGKLLILGATGIQVAKSCRGYSATVEHCTNRPINSVQRSNRKLCSSSSNSSNSSSKIRSFPKIFLETFENAAPVSHGPRRRLH